MVAGDMEITEMPANTQKPVKPGAKPSHTSSTATAKPAAGAQKPMTAKPGSTGRK